MGETSDKGRGFVGLKLEIAIKLYARALGVSIEEAEENVRDAALMTLEAEGFIEPDEDEDDD